VDEFKDAEDDEIGFVLFTVARGEGDAAIAEYFFDLIS